MTLEELAERHCKYKTLAGDYILEPDQLRALIEEAVGIVAGEPVAFSMFDSEDSENKCAFLADDPDLNLARTHPSATETPLHMIDMGRLK